MDYRGDAAALAALYPALTPPVAPAGLIAIREATAAIPASWGMLPAVGIFLDGSEFVTGNGTRAGTTQYLARFYLGEAADLARDQDALMAWAAVLADVLKAHAQLGGRVARAVVDGLEIGLLPFAGRTYAGIESRIHLTTSESWLAAS